MKKLSYKNIHKPTSPLMSKIAISCVSVSTFIAGYGATSENKIIVFSGLAIGIIGTVIAVFYPSVK